MKKKLNTIATFVILVVLLALQIMGALAQSDKIDWPKAFPLEGKPSDYIKGDKTNGGKGFHCDDFGVCGYDYWKADKTAANAVATISGVVTRCGDLDGAGNSVVEIFDGRFKASYLHMDNILIACQAKVQKGQIIGRMGDVGRSDWIHLEYRVYDTVTKKSYDQTDLLPSNALVGYNASTNDDPIVEPIDESAVIAQKCPTMVTNKADEASYPRGITVHHTDSHGDWFTASIGTLHCNEDRPPYLLVVDEEGVVHRTAPYGSKTYHAYDPNNLDYVSISVVGKFETEQLSEKQREGLVNGIRWLIAQGAPPVVVGHRDVRSETSCPGKNLYPLISDIAQEAIGRGKGDPQGAATGYAIDKVMGDLGVIGEVITLLDRAGVVNKEAVLGIVPWVIGGFIALILAIALVYFRIWWLERELRYYQAKPRRPTRYFQTAFWWVCAILLVVMLVTKSRVMWLVLEKTFYLTLLFWVLERGRNLRVHFGFKKPLLPSWLTEPLLFATLLVFIAWLGGIGVGSVMGMSDQLAPWWRETKPRAGELRASELTTNVTYVGLYGHMGPGGWGSMSQATNGLEAARLAVDYAGQIEGLGRPVVPLVNIRISNEDDATITDVIDNCQLMGCVVMLDVTPNMSVDQLIQKWAPMGANVWMDVDLEHAAGPTSAATLNRWASAYFDARKKAGFSEALGVFAFYDFRSPGWLTEPAQVVWEYEQGLVVPIFDGGCMGSMPCRGTKWASTQKVLSQYPSKAQGIMEFVTRWGCGSQYGDCNFTPQEYYTDFKPLIFMGQ